jgi:hypothetical protein
MLTTMSSMQQRNGQIERPDSAGIELDRASRAREAARRGRAFASHVR